LDLLQFAGDNLDELRAAAARALSHTKSALAFDVLNELARDPIWFVRLRAIVSLGKLSDPRAIPCLLRGLTDSNRLVRLRAAEALVELKPHMAPIFGQVVQTRDRYGVHAYLTALENADLRQELVREIQASTEITNEEKDRLQRVLQSGALPAQESSEAAKARDTVALLP
jgi:HEAT repeat protein